MKKVCFVLFVVLLAVFYVGAASADARMNPEKAPKLRVMVYGDSNSFGWVKDEKGTVGRFPADVRWPDRMGMLLGDGYEVIVEALGGRTTNIDCPVQSGPGFVPGAGMNGAAYLPAALASHMPLDLVIIMLGTNDLMVQHNRTAFDIAMGIGQLVSVVTNGGWQKRTAFAAPKVLVLSPSKVNDAKDGPNKERFAGALKRMEELPRILAPLCETAGAEFLDLAAVVPFGEAPDDIHYTAENHAAVAQAVAEKVKTIFASPAPQPMNDLQPQKEKAGETVPAEAAQ